MQRISGTMDQLMPALTEHLNAGATVRLQITGTSMTPLLRNGKDSVLLRSLTRAPGKGDIVLYQRQNGRFVLHRIVGSDKDNYLCCGDNQWKKETVCPEQLQAVVCAYYRQRKKKPVQGLLYWCYVSHLPLRRLFCRLRDTIFQ